MQPLRELNIELAVTTDFYDAHWLAERRPYANPAFSNPVIEVSV
jgi:hypothetical protein